MLGVAEDSSLQTEIEPGSFYPVQPPPAPSLTLGPAVCFGRSYGHLFPGLSPTRGRSASGQALCFDSPLAQAWAPRRHPIPVSS